MLIVAKALKAGREVDPQAPYYPLFHADGANKTNIGKNSRRPAIMQNERTTLVKGENAAKVPDGPTMPRPRPVLLNDAMTAVALVTISLPSKEIRRSDTEKTVK